MNFSYVIVRVDWVWMIGPLIMSPCGHQILEECHCWLQPHIRICCACVYEHGQMDVGSHAQKDWIIPSEHVAFTMDGNKQKWILY